MAFSPACPHARQTHKVVAYLMAITLGLGLSLGGVKARDWRLATAPPAVVEMLRQVCLASEQAQVAAASAAAPAPDAAGIRVSSTFLAPSLAPRTRALWARPPPGAGALVCA